MLDDFTMVAWLAEWFRLIALGYNIIIVARFFRGFTGQPRIAVILQTISQVAMFMLHYLIVFVVVMANFIVSGYVLFGEQLEHWSTFGKFDYQEFHDVAPVNAAIWFGSFFVICVLVVTGLTTATILHHYLTVRSKAGQAGQSILQQ